MRLTAFEKNKLHGGCLEVNRGNANGTGRNSITGRFVICKSTNNVKGNGKKNKRCDDATNMHGRGRNGNFDRKYSKQKLHLEDILSDIRTQHNIQEKSGVEYVDWTQLAYGFCQ